MARHPPKQLSPQRQAWVRRHVQEELAVWERVVRTMGLEGFDPRTAEYRRAWDVYVALKNTAAQHRPRSAGIFSADAGRATAAAGHLSSDQVDAIGVAAMALIRDLAPVVDFIDAGGFPCKLLATAIREAVARCEGINMLLHHADSETGSGGRIPAEAADSSFWTGDGI